MIEEERFKAAAATPRQEASRVREPIAATSTKPKNNFLKIARVFTAVLMLAALVKLIYIGYTRPLPPDVPPAIDSPAETPNSPDAHPSHSPQSNLQLTESITRLKTALDSLPDSESETVRQINQKHPTGPKPCPLEWNHGAVALSMDSAIGNVPPSLTSVINQCADAAEKLVAEREAALRAQQAGRH